MKSKKYTGSRQGFPVFILSIILFDLLLLYFIKYKNQNLSFTDFNLLNTGNILNLLITGVLMAGVLIYTYRIKNNGKFIKVFSITMTVLLVAAVLSTVIPIKTGKVYILGQPLNKVIIGFCFFTFQFVQIYFILLLWEKIKKGSELVYLRAAVKSVFLSLLLLVLAFSYLNIRMSELQGVNQRGNKYDTAVVLGAAVWSNNTPSHSLTARVEKAYQLYSDGRVKKIQLTGSNAPGELAEADVAYRILENKRIRKNDIMLERNTTSTTEQIHFIKYNLLNEHKSSDIVIVSDAYHLVRVKEICSFYNVKAGAAASELKLSFEGKFYNKVRESIALLVFWLFAL